MHRDELRKRYPHSHFTPVWDYDNRLVIRVNGSKLSPTFYFFLNEGGECSFICSTDDFNDGVERSQSTWDPPKELKKYNFRADSLNQIESMVYSVVKKGRTENLRHDDFCVIYHRDSGWHAFYPSLAELIEHHISKPEEEQIPAYLEFIKSDACAEMRKPWDEAGVVQVPH